MTACAQGTGGRYRATRQSLPTWAISRPGKEAIFQPPLFIRWLNHLGSRAAFRFSRLSIFSQQGPFFLPHSHPSTPYPHITLICLFPILCFDHLVLTRSLNLQNITCPPRHPPKIVRGVLGTIHWDRAHLLHQIQPLLLDNPAYKWLKPPSLHLLLSMLQSLALMLLSFLPQNQRGIPIMLAFLSGGLCFHVDYCEQALICTILSLPSNIEHTELSHLLQNHLSAYASMRSVKVVRDTKGGVCAFIQCEASHYSVPSLTALS